MRQIQEDGLLKVEAGPTSPGERPVVWFTLSECFEPTALPRKDGDSEPLSVEELRILAGLFRIGVEASVLVPWEEWRRSSGVEPTFADTLKTLAEERGSDVSDWLISFEPIPKERWVSEEVFYKGNWVQI